MAVRALRTGEINVEAASARSAAKVRVSQVPPRLLAASFLQPDYLVPLLSRERLIERLDIALKCRLIEIRAPTGCGKTTLLYQWRDHLTRQGHFAAWLGVIRPDLDAEDLLASIGWALHMAGISGIPPELLDAAHDRIDPNGSLVELLATVAASQRLVVMLIDDFHLLRRPGPLAVIDALLAAAPPNLHLAIACRSSPGLSVARLEARGLTYRVSVEELLFSLDEARAVLVDEMSPRDASILVEHTAGWPIAVQLARLWFKQVPNREKDLLHFPQYTGSVATYLTNQVINSLEEDLRSFLIDTSILSRVSPSLADAIRGRSDSDTFLMRLRSFAPLLMPIAGTANIYKLHPLLAEQLREKLREQDSARFSAMHRAAAHTFAGIDQLFDAVRHAKLVGDPDLANSLIAAREPVIECLLRGPSEIRPCLQLLDEREWQRNPHVWLARIFLQWRDSQFSDAEREFSHLRSTHPTGNAQFVRDTVVLQVVLCRSEPASIENVLRECDRQLTDAGAHNDMMRALLNTLRAISDLQAGRLTAAESTIHDALAFYERSVAPVFILHGQLHVSWIAAVRGELAKAHDLLEKICRVAQRFGSAERGVRILARAYILGIEYEGGQLSLPPAEINTLLDDLERAWVWYDFFVTAYKVAIETAFQREGAAAALSMVARGRAAVGVLGFEESAERALTAFEAGVLARSGDPLSALNRIAGFNTGARTIRTWYEFDALMFATAVAYLAQRRASEALATGRLWEERAEIEGRRAAICRAALIVALSAWIGQRHAQAKLEMRRAILISCEERMFAPFLEHAPASRNDLEALLESSVEGANDRITDFVAELRALLSGSYGGTHAISRLSEREREVLGALCNRESNKFIARRLGVSENAVKFHVKNIFRKLGVHSRREAVESAFLQS